MLRLERYIALAAALACDPEQAPEAADAVEFDDEAEDLAAPPRPSETYSGWTPFTSEEYPPIGCDPGSLVTRFGCRGSYCDNVRLYCTPSGQASGSAYWTGYFSEEGYDYRQCDAGFWLSAIACRGSYCDNIALQCTYYPQVTPRNCYWTGWVSEEGGGELPFGTDYYARGVQCDGSYCDNKRFFVCQK